MSLIAADKLFAAQNDDLNPSNISAENLSTAKTNTNEKLPAQSNLKALKAYLASNPNMSSTVKKQQYHELESTINLVSNNKIMFDQNRGVNNVVYHNYYTKQRFNTNPDIFGNTMIRVIGLSAVTNKYDKKKTKARESTPCKHIPALFPAIFYNTTQ